jgi:hypothetical protein
MGIEIQGSREWPADASEGIDNHYVIHVSRRICLVVSDSLCSPTDV